MEKLNLDLGEVTIAYDPDTARLTSAFFAEDDIGAIIRCHFEVERSASRALDVMTGGRWKKTNSRYLLDKLNLLEMIGSPTKLISPARILNNHRNEFAHKGKEEVTEQEMLDLVRGVQAFIPHFSHEEYRVLIQGRKVFDGRFSECSRRQKYVVASAHLMFLIGGLPEILDQYKKTGQRPAD